MKYRDEIVPTQKAHRSTTATLNMLMKHRIAYYSLTQLKSVHLYKFKKEMSVGRAPKTDKITKRFSKVILDEFQSFLAW